MKLFKISKDGGAESTVWGLFLVEIKSLFSIALLCFEDGSRDAYHTHAFNSVSWVLRGRLVEETLDGEIRRYRPSFWPVITRRDTFHQVVSRGRSWVLTFRGPWVATWFEYLPQFNRCVRLMSGRKEV